MNPIRTLLCLCLTAVSALALPCALAYGANPMSLIDEKAIIIWNPASHMEHFIRQASFKGNAKDFGFIVPTPGKPEIAVAQAAAFTRLEDFVNPPSRELRNGLGGGGFGGAGGGVVVIEQTRVGDYLATVLLATDGKAMLGWLHDNGYNSRPALEPWLDHYAQMGWYFTALKFVRESEQTSPATKALRISFQSDAPYYPYRMPSDTWPEGHYRPLALYFIGPNPVNGIYRESYVQWEAKRIFTGKLPAKLADALAKDAGLEPSEIPDGSVLTAFLNTRNAIGYDRDLIFLNTNRSGHPLKGGGGLGSGIGAGMLGAVLSMAALIGGGAKLR